MSWWNSSRAVYGAELRAGALCLVDHGWPVVPGTWWGGEEMTDGADAPAWSLGGADWTSTDPGSPVASGPSAATALPIDADWSAGFEWDPVPAVPGGVATASCDPAQVARWWSVAPHSVLVATGTELDALEVPAWMGRRMAATLRSVDVVAPLAATPSGRWWFPVALGGPELPEYLTEAGMVRHSTASWVIAPPSECADGLVHWRVNPSACGWRLPPGELVMTAGAEAARWREAEGEHWSVAQRPTGLASGMRS
jgi:hypothetical protein